MRLTGSARIGDTPIFKDLDLSLEAGAWTCLLGASGVGKTTVLKLFAGLDEAVTLSGHLEAPERVALMAQSDMLLPWLSALDNVVIGAKLRGDRVDLDRGKEVLSRVGLADQAARKPTALSGGQRQRVALARTLMEDRDVVLLDEPFSALDALTRAQMQDLTAELLADRTVLLITHDPLEAARLGDRIVIMTAHGLADVPVPQGRIPRALDAQDVLQTQANLLNQLRMPS